MTHSESPRQLLALCELLGICRAEEELDWSKVTPAECERIVKWLFRFLDTLDSKTSHLLGQMSLIVAAQSILVAVAVTLKISATSIVILLMLLLVPLLGAYFALRVFEVKWPFLDWRKTHDHPNPNHSSMFEECIEVAKVCDRRVDAHQRVLRFSVASLVAIAASIALIGVQLL